MSRTKVASQHGRDTELRVAELLFDDGWLVSSRRHIGGAGDLLAVRPGHRPLLIEVKSTAKCWHKFGPEERRQMVLTAGMYGCKALLAWWPRGGELQWLDQNQWPSP